MDKIQHKQVDVGRLNLHVAEIGSGPAVLLLHGFPEIWYSWRYQMTALAEAGFHAIAPDLRGYGLSDQPSEPEKATFFDIVEDLVGLLDALGIEKVSLWFGLLVPVRVPREAKCKLQGYRVFLHLNVIRCKYIERFAVRVLVPLIDQHGCMGFVVGKDFGAAIAYYFDLCHPDRVKGIVTLGVPYRKPGEFAKADSAPKGFYVRHWQEPGRGLADFGRFDVKTVIRNIYTLFSGSELPVAEDGKEIMDLYDPSTPLPPWFTEDDLQMYSSLYEKSGFVFPLQVPYLCCKRDWGKLSHFRDCTVQAPCLLIMGNKDYVMKFPGMEYYIKSEMIKSDVPNLEIKHISEGSHFVQEQFPEEVNKLLVGFLNQHL